MEMQTEKLNLTTNDLCQVGTEIFYSGLIKNKIAVGDFIVHCKDCTTCGDYINRYIANLKPYLFANLLNVKKFFL